MRKGDESVKILLITVAGLSSRFSKSLGRECLKCLYHERDIRECLLYRMLQQSPFFDKYIIVGGFRFDELKDVLERDFTEFRDKMILVENEKYAEYGSGYSLYAGLKAAFKLEFDELVFAEGDLYVDAGSFGKVCTAKNNVITRNAEPILASKAVAYYFDVQYGIHYIYDTSHSTLEIREPFLGIFNSGQIWKFAQPDKLRETVQKMDAKAWQGTNLELIQRYFGGLDEKEYEMVAFERWVNCNTVDDYKSI